MAAIGTTKTAIGRRRLSLATRAALCVAGLLAVTAALCAATVVAGFEGESRRRQAAGAEEVTRRVVRYSVNAMASGDHFGLVENVARMASRSEVRRVSVRDLSGRLQAEAGEELAEEHVLFERAMEEGGALAVRTRDGQLVMAEPITRAGRVLGVAIVTIKPEGFRYDAFWALAPFLILLGCLALVFIPLTAYYVRRVLAPLEALTRFAEKIGEPGEATQIALRTGDEFETLAGAFNRMVTRLNDSVRKMQQIAFVDPATQLPNQDRFQREVDFFILQAQQSGETGAVMVFDLTRLPRLMQTLDPEASRELIRIVSERFTHAVRMADRLVRLRLTHARPALPARLGSHDFGVLAPGLSSPADAARFAQHVNSAIDQPFDWRGHKVSLGAAGGVALAPRDGKDADAAIRHARMALAAAQGAPARLKVYTRQLDRAAVAKLTLEREMRAALERNEFHAHFQPKMNLVTGRVEAAEALARWIRPDRTIISPSRFIPAAEESGLIGPLADAILREACWKAAGWARAGAPAKISVNVSALQFRDDRFAENVLHIVRHAGLSPSFLELEVTESVAMEDPERALKLIEPLRAAGIRFAIDDFGCGHSSLAALSKLPFDVIKIDQQFVRALKHNDMQAAAIIEMILALASTLNLDVVAEGIERREQAEFLLARGCTWGQGFLYGAAVTAGEFSELLRLQDQTPAPTEDAA